MENIFRPTSEGIVIKRLVRGRCVTGSKGIGYLGECKAVIG